MFLAIWPTHQDLLLSLSTASLPCPFKPRVRLLALNYCTNTYSSPQAHPLLELSFDCHLFAVRTMTDKITNISDIIGTVQNLLLDIYPGKLKPLSLFLLLWNSSHQWQHPLPCRALQMHWYTLLSHNQKMEPKDSALFIGKIIQKEVPPYKGSNVLKHQIPLL